MEKTEINYAGFWKRYAAHMLDFAIIVFFTSSLRWLLMDLIDIYRLDEIFDYGSDSYRMNKFWSFMWWNLQLTLISWCYYAGMESSPFQATAGKMLCGLYVADARTGGRVNFGKATGRHFAKILSGLILYIGYILAAFTDRKQALHDSMSECVVMSR